ncbi:MAG: UvrD-helicase domain-containing protein [Thermoleophilia bacterium]
MTDIELTPDQLKAIETLDGPVFVAAGAGSGKTGVVTRRFVHAIATGYAAVDEILTITFTKKAAAEMMERIRGYLRTEPADDAGLARMAEAYREIELAQISTIDSFCASLLRANALAAGIDPNFTAVDDSQAGLIREEVFDDCLKRLVSDRSAEAVEFIAAYDPNLNGALFETITDVYADLRSQGKKVTLPYPELPDIVLAERELLEVTIAAREAATQISEPNGNQSKGLEKLARLELALAESDPALRVHQAEMKEIRPGSMGPAKEAFSLLEEPRVAFVNAVRSSIALKTLGLFRELLESFNRKYAEAKHERGVLDFADLAVRTRDLLRDKPEIAKRVSSRYRLIMVDEFQDTNALQHELIELIANDNLFLVGDENQAIYGFRYADVELFRKEKEKAREKDYLIELKNNFRSQSQIIDFADHVFNRESMLAPGYLELEASAPLEEEYEECRVEVILVDSRRNDKKIGLEAVKKDITRPAEAQLIAERLNELFKEGYSKSDVAILMKTKTDAEIYRNALDRAGIENYFSVGSSYFGKLEVNDVLNILKLIINPLDDIAMLAVLRSPLAGVSDNALYWLRQKCEGDDPKFHPIWPTLNSLDRFEHLDVEDRAKLSGFAAWLGELRQVAGRLTLRGLVHGIVNHGDYAAMMAAGPEGRQNLANLLKLLDLAGDFEISWGNDLKQFTDFLEHQKDTEVREIEAPTEAEGVDAVRIMTMHSAKGLEFPLVVLPKLEARGRSYGPDIILDRDGGDRVGMNFKTNGAGGGKAFAYGELKDEAVIRNRREGKRLGYVAITRARKHLILSGVADAEKPPNMEKQSDPPFDWLRSLLHLYWDRDENLGKVDRIEDINGTTVGLQIETVPEGAAARYLQAQEKHRSLETPRIDPKITVMPKAAVYVPPSISPTALDAFRACPRRYFLERVLRAGQLFEDGRTGKAAAATSLLSNTDMGVLVHKILEEDLPALASEPATAEMVSMRALQVLESGVELAPADTSRVIGLIENLRRAPVAAELFRAAASGALQRELNFSTLLGSTILKGQIDAYCQTGEGALVVDYKSGTPGEGRTTAEAAESYRYQMTSYALAAMRMNPGTVKVVLVYLGADEPREFLREFRADDISGLESELQAIIDSMADGAFPPLSEFDAHHCSWCVAGGDAGLCMNARLPASSDRS